MKINVSNFLLDFDSLPPLAPALAGTTGEYWLVGDNFVQRRHYTRLNIIEDLYVTLGQPILQGYTELKVYLSAPWPEAQDLEPLRNQVKVRLPKTAWCQYDALLDDVVALYPDVPTCAETVGITYRSIMACNSGDIAIIKGHIIIANRYLPQEELDIRRETTVRTGMHPVRIYAYDYNGEPVGTFLTISEAAISLGMDYKTLHKGIMVPHKMIHGYYLYTNPNTKPPINK